jgi:thioredoxin-dependent peroxiredoxin
MLKINEQAPKFEFTGPGGEKNNFPADFKGKWLALIFLRHLGCPLCMEKLNELNANFQKYQDQGLELCVVVQSTEKRVQDYIAKKSIKFNMVPDHGRTIYELYGVAKGGLGAFLAPAVTVATIRATLKGNFHGPFEGDELQKPASFIIDPDGKLAFLEYGKNIADITKEERLFEAFAQAKARKGK